MKFKRRGSAKSKGSGRSSDRQESAPSNDHSPRSVNGSSMDIDEELDIRRTKAFEGVNVPIDSNGRIRAEEESPRHRRSTSAHARRYPEVDGFKIIGTSEQKRRSKSSGRVRRQAVSYSEAMAASKDSSDKSLGEKRRKSKIEKIRQLQAKNGLYKEEYKRVQKDRKQLKKEIEAKKQEVSALTKEVDTYIAETSVLKLKLSEALQQLDQTDQTTKKDHNQMEDITRELTIAREDLDSAWTRVADLKEELEEMREQVRRKDEQIESLTSEVAEQTSLVQSLQEDNARLEEEAQKKGADDEDTLGDLTVQNENLKTELGSTLERAAAMVKEREEAIADLLKENDEMKRLLSIRDDSKHDISEDDFLQLKVELDNAHAELEEAQDRAIALEEEVESWINRGAEMESEIDRLRDEVEGWERKTNAYQETVSVVEASAKEATEEAQAAKEKLAEAEARFKSELAESERVHRAAILEARADARRATERADAGSAGSAASISSAEERKAEASDAQAQQAMLLEQAVASRQKKTDSDGSKGGWLSSFRKPAVEEEEELTEEQKRIRELEAINEDQSEEIKKLKSEMVRLRSTYNETMYMNKKKIERLSHENEAYEVKVSALERELAEANGDTLQPEEES